MQVSVWFEYSVPDSFSGTSAKRFSEPLLAHDFGHQVRIHIQSAEQGVMRKPGHTRASTSLLQKQMQLFGKVLRSSPEGPLALASFIPGTAHPATDRYVRRVGRPRKEWISEMTRHAVRLFGDMRTVSDLARQPLVWKAVVRQKFEA